MARVAVARLCRRLLPSLPKLLEFRLSFTASPLEHAPELAEARLGGDDPPEAGLPKLKKETTAAAAAACRDPAAQTLGYDTERPTQVDELNR